MLMDLRLALRQLAKSRGFALTAVLTLALGTGATTAIFTLVHAVLLKSLPVAKPEELYRIGDKAHCCMWGGYTQWEEYSLLNYELYQRFRDNTPAFSDLAAFEAGNSGLSVRRMGSEQPVQAGNGEYVSGNYFRTFGIGPWAGRVINENDDREGSAPVVVMSYRTWQQKFGRDPSVVGSTLLINAKPFTVIGIAPPGFFGGALKSWGMPEYWIPLAEEPVLAGTNSFLKQPEANWLYVIGRVRPGTDPKALEAQLRLELRQWQVSHLPDMGPQDKERMAKQGLHLTPGGSGVTQMREQYHDGLRLLLIAAGCVLLIACSNLANLLLARGLAHKQQTAVRMALGASRVRMVRKALVESLLLGLLGGIAGLVIAYAGTSMILHLAFSGPNSYVPIEAAPSLPVLFFALAISLITGICFGVAPAWVASHADPVEAMRGANRSTTKKSSFPQKALVAAQAGLSLVLLSAAVMLSQSLHNLEHQHFGFETKDRYVGWIDPALAGYLPEQLPALYERLQERLQSVPGVRQAAFSSYAPMSGDDWGNSVYIEGKPEPRAEDNSGAAFGRITPGFFEMLQTPMVMGRSITDEDTASSRHVAVINEAFAKKFFKEENPIGKHFGSGELKRAGDYEVIGVVKDIRYIVTDRDAIEPMYYMAEAQTIHYEKPDDNVGEGHTHYLYNLVVWAPGAPAGLAAQLRKAFVEVDPNLTIQEFKSYDSAVSFDFRQEGLIAELTSLFGGLALVLAAVGIYGVTAYGVEQRINEIGIRMALGADRFSVVRMVLRGAFLQVGIGLLIGIPAAISAGHAMSAQLFAVQPWNPIILASAVMLLGFAALVAAVIPSRRAASVDPVVALRND
jgi:putative ABC transport system permease protein